MLEIKIYPDPVLKRQCQEVEKIDDEIRTLVQQMLKTLYAHQGIGLAAPQIGIKKKIIIVDIGKGPIVLINPEIKEKSIETEIAEEGCLSLPKTFIKIERSKNIVAAGLDEYGKPVEIKASGLTARAIQHEIDHLSGILIIDKPRTFSKGDQTF